MGGAKTESHYDVLGVSATASYDEVRKAYLSAARQWHPDRHGGGTALEAAQAEAEMRRVNQAWEVLGDRQARLAYDQRLTVATQRAARPKVNTDDEGVTRIDPRLLDPEFLNARREAQVADISNRQSMALRTVPLLGLLGMLAGIFVFTAYARTAGAPAETTVPGPNLGSGIEANDCVRITSGPQLIEVACVAGASLVTGAHLGDGSCPLGSAGIELAHGVVACLDTIE